MKIIVYVDQWERFEFFSRFDFGIYEPIFVAVRYSLYRQALKEGFNCIFVKQGASKRKVDVSLCRDVMAGYLSFADAEELYSNVWGAVRECFSEIAPLHSVWLWNGSDVAEKAVSDLAKEQSVRTVFLEISNIPGSLFVDVNGVNCCSAIYLTKGRCLDSVSVDAGEWGRFKEKYIREKNSKSTVPQAKVARSINLAFLFDYFGQKILGGSIFQSRSILEKLLTVVGRKRLSVENSGLVSERYLFLPFQVSTDSQILLNSEIDNAGALEFAVQEAEKLSASLVVKLHPAESSAEARATLIRMCSEKGVVLTNENTFKLVSESQKVITINSTVGLEALISGVEVGFLGRSFYEYLNTEERLSKYVLGWLYDCDYFGSDQVCFESLVRHVEMIEAV